jgi:excisionase family DNA binding protein
MTDRALPRSVPPRGLKMLLTQSEAAEALGTSVDFIRSLVASGQVGFVAVGNHERVPVEELDRWWRAQDSLAVSSAWLRSDARNRPAGRLPFPAAAQSGGPA